jgi:alpha-methylacyl-CoA racemase
LLAVAAKADVLIEGFRPGTMEKLGLGPDDVQAVNLGLIYGRMTGWGQSGPMARAAGHDINYLSLTGALHAIGCRNEGPLPPLNLVADFGGGSLYLALGVLSALYDRQRSGRGQIVDAAMVDGASSLMTMAYALFAAGAWTDERGANLLDGGAPWYATYQCADGKYVAVGALERKFFLNLLRALDIDSNPYPDHHDKGCWSRIRRQLSEKFRSRTRDDWCALLQNQDCCVTPVRSMSEAAADPHLASRATFLERNGVMQPAPAPRFSRTPAALPRVPPVAGEEGPQVLMEWQVDGCTPDVQR